jgi:hypothetical protein
MCVNGRSSILAIMDTEGRFALMAPESRRVAECSARFGWSSAGGQRRACGGVFDRQGASIGIDRAGVSLAFDLTVLTMADTIGHSSGCHLDRRQWRAERPPGSRPPGRSLPAIIAHVIGIITGRGCCSPSQAVIPVSSSNERGAGRRCRRPRDPIEARRATSPSWGTPDALTRYGLAVFFDTAPAGDAPPPRQPDVDQGDVTDRPANIAISVTTMRKPNTSPVIRPPSRARIQ